MEISLVVKGFQDTVFPDPIVDKDVLVSRVDLTKETKSVYFLAFNEMNKVEYTSYQALQLDNLDLIEFVPGKPLGEYTFKGCK